MPGSSGNCTPANIAAAKPDRLLYNPARFIDSPIDLRPRFITCLLLLRLKFYLHFSCLAPPCPAAAAIVLLYPLFILNPVPHSRARMICRHLAPCLYFIFLFGFDLCPAHSNKPGFPICGAIYSPVWLLRSH